MVVSLQYAKGFKRSGKGPLRSHRKIAINIPADLFERISARASAAKRPFTVEAVDLLRCGLLDVEDSERHEPWPHLAPP